MKIKHLLKLKNEGRTISGPITPAPPGPSQELNQTFPTTVAGAPETSQTFPTKAKSPQTGQTVSSTDDDFDKFKAGILGNIQTYGKGDKLPMANKKPSSPSVGTIEKNLQNLSIQESIRKLDEISRRDFLKGAGAATIGAMMHKPSNADNADNNIEFTSKQGSMKIIVTPKGVVVRTAKPVNQKIVIATIDGDPIELEQDSPTQYHDRYSAWKSILPKKNSFIFSVGDNNIKMNRTK